MVINPDDMQMITPTKVAGGDRAAGVIVTAPTVSPLVIQLIGDEL